MKSATLPSFWEAYASLDESIKRRARKAFQLWAQNPFHPTPKIAGRAPMPGGVGAAAAFRLWWCPVDMATI